MPEGKEDRRQKQQQQKKKMRTTPKEQDEETCLVSRGSACLDSLPWNASLADCDDDSFSALQSGCEGGFLSLEEIDEVDFESFSEYLGQIGDKSSSSVSSVTKKRKKGKGCDDDSSVADGGGGEQKKTDKKKRKKKKRAKKSDKNMADFLKENKENTVALDPDNAEGVDALDGCEKFSDVDNNLFLDEYEVYAWKSLRLNEMLMKAIRFLGFKEPTMIQKACIPAAAHQGKDVIGAAETGSGKTLAFGLPILQRLLEEQEKASRLVQKEGETDAVDKGGPLRALILTPTRELALQVADHLKAVAKFTRIQVVPIVGGMSKEKQERLLQRHPEIVVGTPGRLWEIISEGERHLTELHSLSFFVLDEADRMIENGHFNELNSIIDMLPHANVNIDGSSKMCKTVPNVQLKKRQTFVFSATLALSDRFRKKLKHGSFASMPSRTIVPSSIETLSERAGIRPDAAIVDLTNSSIMTSKLEESFIECKEQDKDIYLYYILSVHGHGRALVFCTSIAALRRVSSLLRILGVEAWTLHAQMQQRARLKSIDRFRGNDNSVLIATDVAARGLDVPGIRTVVHYQLPHSAEVYIHRSGRTARASEDGCSIALISPSDKMKFTSLCKSLSKETLNCFPLSESYMPEVMRRVSLANQIDKISRKITQETTKKNWYDRAAKSVELDVEDSASEEERVSDHIQKKSTSQKLENLRQELSRHLAKPLQPKTLSHKYLAGAGLSPFLQQQLEELSKRKCESLNPSNNKRSKLVVVGQDCKEPLEALRSSGHEVCVNVDKLREMKRLVESRKRKRREEKKRANEVRKKQNKSRRKNQEER